VAWEQLSEILPLVVLILPVLLLIVAEPNSFSFFWFWKEQIGRGTFIFIVFLAAWDWLDSRSRLQIRKERWRHLLIAALTLSILVYYWERATNIEWTNQMRQYVISIGVSPKAPLSFLLAMDFIVYAAFAIAVVALVYGRRATTLIVTPAIYAIGSGLLDMMDAYYPEDSLAFMQQWVYVLWNTVILVLRLIGFHVISSPSEGVNPPTVLLTGNRLLVWGKKGYLQIVIYWPSSGVVSMLVFMLVIAVLMIKLEAPRNRKLVYTLLGAAGTFFVNVIRIALITIYVAYISLDVKTFHDMIGETLFLIWIIIFLFAVLRNEARISQRKLNLSLKSPCVSLKKPACNGASSA
jgi:thaumarchaeosortase